MCKIKISLIFFIMLALCTVIISQNDSSVKPILKVYKSYDKDLKDSTYVFEIMNNSVETIKTSTLGFFHNRLRLESPNGGVMEYCDSYNDNLLIRPGESMSWKYDVEELISMLFGKMYPSGTEFTVEWMLMDTNSPTRSVARKRSKEYFKTYRSEKIKVKINNSFWQERK